LIAIIKTTGANKVTVAAKVARRCMVREGRNTTAMLPTKAVAIRMPIIQGNTGREIAALEDESDVPRAVSHGKKRLRVTRLAPMRETESSLHGRVFDTLWFY
jgi:hypothetical protein